MSRGASNRPVPRNGPRRRAWPLLLLAGLVTAAPAPGHDVALQALSVFQAKCAPCHGTSLKQPEANFGHVDDLARLSADSRKVVPGKPEESALFQRIAIKKDMPPKRLAKRLGIEPLTDDEIGAIREWIAAGARTPLVEAAHKP